VPTAADPVAPDALAAWAGKEPALAGDGRVEVAAIGEGHSNLTFRVTRGSASWVLRRPPAGPLLPTAHDVVREYRVLSLLGAAEPAVRVPHVVALCADPGVIGAPFYLMDEVHGVVVRDPLPARLEGDPAAQRALGLDLVDALAEIHGTDWKPFVAAGIGRPAGYLARQLKRWAGQREGIQEAVAAAGGRARDLPDYDSVRDWLGAHLPDEAEPAVVHGDFKLDNAIVDLGDDRTTPPRIAAVVDWEMATVGDPRADLGYLLSFWPEPGETFPLGRLVASGPGFPHRDELVSQWAAATGRDPADTRWFVTLAIWKLAILLEASYHRWLAGMSDDPFFAALDQGVPALLARARETSGA
jgi:aminoglycoside phosphotransferase (APT) family kinase protein